MNIIFAVAPSSPTVNVLQTSADSLTLRWEVLSDGRSPIVKTVISYKTTYGEWSSQEVPVYYGRDDASGEHTLEDLHCGREYHTYVVLVNALGSSPTSEVLTVRTRGDRPTAPSTEGDAGEDAETAVAVGSFLRANTTFVSMALDRWDDHGCQILYFVVEYRLSDEENWITGSERDLF